MVLAAVENRGKYKPWPGPFFAGVPVFGILLAVWYGYPGIEKEAAPAGTRKEQGG
jgi:hypothetical protein